jgi:hypothetical protein
MFRFFLWGNETLFNLGLGPTDTIHVGLRVSTSTIFHTDSYIFGSYKLSMSSVEENKHYMTYLEICLMVPLSF